MNPDDLEIRLRAVSPPEPPWELTLRLRAAQPPASAQPPGWRGVLRRGFGRPWWGPWQVAYAGVMAIWGLIVLLRLLTLPLLPASSRQPAVAQASETPPPVDAAASPERTFLLTRNGSLDPAWQ